jgi:hypothetical protein
MAKFTVRISGNKNSRTFVVTGREDSSGLAGISRQQTGRVWIRRAFERGGRLSGILMSAIYSGFKSMKGEINTLLNRCGSRMIHKSKADVWQTQRDKMNELRS